MMTMIRTTNGIPNNPRPRKIRDRGFIALMSAIIIATILLLVATTGGLTGIFARGDALDAELKARSVGAADACVDLALLALANGDDPTVAPYALNSLDKCRVVSVTPASGETSIRIHAVSGNGADIIEPFPSAAVTNLEVVVDSTDLSVISWREVATF